MVAALYLHLLLKENHWSRFAVHAVVSPSSKDRLIWHATGSFLITPDGDTDNGLGGSFKSAFSEGVLLLYTFVFPSNTDRLIRSVVDNVLNIVIDDDDNFSASTENLPQIKIIPGDL